VSIRLSGALPRASSRRDNRRVAGPFLKWAGGKAKLAPRILDLAPAGFGRYHEPFLGGGAVFFAVEAAGRAHAAVLSDANADLIHCFAAVRDDTEAVIAELGRLAADYLPAGAAERAAFYYARRAAVPASPAAAAARLIFLNRTCYNGLYRVNRRGQFNVPFGRHANPTICDEPGLRAASAALQRAHLEVADFEIVLRLAEPGDLVYFDPPYAPLSPTSSFTNYTTDGFTNADQARLADVYRALDRRGCLLMLSNSSAPLIRDLYQDFHLNEISARRAINSKPDRRGIITELLITNYPRADRGA
jgi:DNA adenine methylase